LGAAFKYSPFGVVFCIAAGAYLSAKKAGVAFVSNAEVKSAGDVDVIEGGPKSPVDEVQTSRRPQALRTSSIRVSVASSEVVG
jgi:hypothetical protein